MPDSDAADAEWLRIPRRSRTRWPVGELLRIAMMIVALIAVVTLRAPCAEGVAGFFRTFDPPAERGPKGRSVVPAPPALPAPSSR